MLVTHDLGRVELFAESLNNLNADILGAAGFPFHNTWMFDRIRPEQADMIYQLSRLPEHQQYLQAFEQQSPWVWKDPRLCYTLAYWWPMMNPQTQPARRGLEVSTLTQGDES